MTKHVDKLNAMKVAKLTKLGMHADGSGLYLQVNSPVSKCWVFRYQLRGKKRKMGLGSVREIGLAQAREKVREIRQQLRAGIDPVEQRHQERLAMDARQKKLVDFDSCAQKYIEGHASSWSNQKHRKQWESTLLTYASPVFGKRPVSEIDTNLVLQVLEPIWAVKTETAQRLRERIEKVLAWAKLRGYREGDNPAQWKDHLEQLLPKPTRVKRVKHHAALPFSQLPDFMKELRQSDALASLALQFTILTACRTSEVIGAKWSEFDLTKSVWTIPLERMKTRCEHRVPLSKQVLSIIDSLQPLKVGDDPWLLPGGKMGKPMTNMAMLKLLERMKKEGITVHGFRSTFRDWVSETTDYRGEVAEMALAHAIESAVEAAYRRGDLFKKRVTLMQDWANFCFIVP